MVVLLAYVVGKFAYQGAKAAVQYIEERQVKKGIKQTLQASIQLLLESDHPQVCAPAACALKVLAACREKYRMRITAAGVIPRLVQLLHSNAAEVHSASVGLLAALVRPGDNTVHSIAAAGGIPPLVRLLDSKDAQVQYSAAAVLKVVAQNDPSRFIAAAGAIPPLVRLLGSSVQAVQTIAASALLTLAQSVHNQSIATAGAIPALVRLLENSNRFDPNATHAQLLMLNQGAQAQRLVVVAALSTLAWQSSSSSAAIAASNAIPSLVGMLCAAAPFAAQQAAISALRTLTLHVSAVSVAVHSAGGIPLLMRLRETTVHVNDRMLVKETLLHMTTYCHDSTTLQALADTKGVITLLVKLLGSPDATVQHKAVVALGQLARFAPKAMTSARMEQQLKELAGNSKTPQALRDTIVCIESRFKQALQLPNLEKRFAKSQAELSVQDWATLTTLSAQPDIAAQAALELDRLAHSNRTAPATAAGRVPFAVYLLNSDLVTVLKGGASQAEVVASIPLLVQMLGSRSVAMQERAARVLGRLSLDSTIGEKIARAGGIPLLVQLLYSNVAAVRGQAVQAVHNVSLTDANRISIAALGGIPPLVEQLRSNDSTMQGAAAETLRQLAAHQAVRASIVHSGAIPPLMQLSNSSVVGVRQSAMRAIASLT